MPAAATVPAALIGDARVSGGVSRTEVAMDTFVTIHVADGDPDALDRAFGWFREVEARCSRFEPASELRQLMARVDEDVELSTLLFEAVQFAIAVAEETNGLFDPTVGHAMARRGFNRAYRTGELTRPAPPEPIETSYRDVHVDRVRRTVRLCRPVGLDLGAVAKGLAIDLAARELASFTNYAIDAGGDLYLAGRTTTGAPWTVGIRHPYADTELLDVIHVSDRAVCTSGDYERRGADGRGHILDPRSGAPAGQTVSATVLAPTAMLADTLATAAFVLGPTQGIALLERHGAEGMLVAPSLERHETPGYRR